MFIFFYLKELLACLPTGRDYSHQNLQKKFWWEAEIRPAKLARLGAVLRISNLEYGPGARRARWGQIRRNLSASVARPSVRPRYLLSQVKSVSSQPPLGGSDFPDLESKEA